MRWLITGAGGQLAHHLTAVLAGSQDEVSALSERELDITDSGAVVDALDALCPDVVVNTAAYTAVDAAETDPRRAELVNATGPGLLAAALRTSSGRLLQVSTDYVFAGTFPGTEPRPYEPDDPTDPRTVYGRSKLAGEKAVRSLLPERSTVVRTAWLHGGPGPNFVGTMLRLAAERPSVDVVFDQVGSPTWAGDLAAALVALGRSQVTGTVLHYANAGTASWFELAREVFRLAGADPERVRPVDTAAFPRPAPRPAWSVLSTRTWTAAGLPAPRPWQEGAADSVAAQLA